MRNVQNRRVFKKLPLAVAVLGCLHAGAVFAQVQDPEDAEEQATTQEQPAKQSAVELDTITVTGSLIRRVEYDSVSPVQVITADTSASVGQISTADFLQKSSVAAGSTQFSNQFSGFVIEGGTGVQSLSLRGLGAQRTLVLLNGNRPGPAGTRGQVGAFDLNVIPSSILQRAEILKDGASSIYGSDAVAGVVNLITRKTVDRPELSFNIQAPFSDGGETYSVSGATGWNFDNGSIVLAGDYYIMHALQVGDRDYFSCGRDLLTDGNGNSVDRVDRSVTAGTDLGGCNNLYANTVFDLRTGARYIPSPDGVTIGPLPGYRPRRNGNYGPGNTGQAFYEDQLNFDFAGQQDIFSRQERKSVYAASDFSFGEVNWTTEWLYNQRSTEARRFRQFFPVIGGANAPAGFQYANDPTYTGPIGFARPVLPFRSDQDIEVDYYYVNTALDGYLPFRDWSWKVNASYSRSSGDYSALGIQASRSGDVTLSDDAPSVNYFDPGFLNGARMDELVDAIGAVHTGNTMYDQLVVGGVVTGELFNLPAGAVGAAFGVEYRDFSIDDQPSELSRGSDLWGQSSAQVTKGEDKVKEVFAELEIPLLKGLPAVESLTLNVSGRVFDYDSVAESDSVWKAGLGWQITPAVRLRATKGTSYRAPGLYELYLGDQTGFLSQVQIDPCINYFESTNDRIRANCAAAGIPDNYVGDPTSAVVFQGGGAGFLKPETSEAFTAGIIFTPAFAPISIALDYFEFEVKDQIATLDAGSILGGCYGAPVFPNNFCDLFIRNPGTDPTAPFKIEEVYATYLNINSQRTEGFDLLMRYEDDFSFGNLEVEGQFTYVSKDVEQLFDSAIASGFDTNNRRGEIGRPKLVGNLRTALKRGDFTYTWFMDYVDSTEALTVSPVVTPSYFGYVGALRDLKADSRVYHAASVRYEQADWSLLLGVRNLFGTEPPKVSAGAASRYGDVPAFATQYDWLGRTLFARLNYRF